MAPGTDRWVVVTRYVRDDGRIIRHVYSGPDDKGWPTRARAQTSVRRQLRDDAERHGQTVVDAMLANGRLEINAVQVTAL